MNALRRFLVGKLEPGIYVLEDNLQVNTVKTVVEEAGYNFFYLDGEVISDTEDFFKTVETVYLFPYFGRNWNAFDDCMGDLSWLPQAKGNVTLYDGFQRFAQNVPDEFKRAFYGLRYATRIDWTVQPMYVFLRGNKVVLPLSDVDGTLSVANDVDSSSEAD